MRMGCVVICGLSGSILFIEHKKCVLIFFTNLKYFSFYENLTKILAQIYINIHLKYPLFLSYINKKLTFIVSIFQYISNKIQRYTVYLYLKTALHVSAGTSTHHQERMQLYLQHLVFVTPLLLPAAIVEELELV
jgi:hypothetical protein